MFKAENATHVLEIWQDECTESPRDWGSPSTFLTWERDCASPDRNSYHTDIDFLVDIADDFKPGFAEYWEDTEDHEESMVNLYAILDKHYLILTVYKYEHSGVAYNTDGFACPFDSGACGYIYISKKDALKEWGEDEALAIKYMKGEIETYSNWASGEVYGFTVSEKTSCDTCGHTAENVVDSCGGFYGLEFQTNGMVDHLAEEFYDLLNEVS